MKLLLTLSLFLSSFALFKISDVKDTNIIHDTFIVNGDQLFLAMNNKDTILVELVDEQVEYFFNHQDQEYALLYVNDCKPSFYAPGDLYVTPECQHFIYFNDRKYIAPDIKN